MKKQLTTEEKVRRIVRQVLNEEITMPDVFHTSVGKKLELTSGWIMIKNVEVGYIAGDPYINIFYDAELDIQSPNGKTEHQSVKNKKERIYTFYRILANNGYNINMDRVKI